MLPGELAVVGLSLYKSFDFVGEFFDQIRRSQCRFGFHGFAKRLDLPSLGH